MLGKAFSTFAQASLTTCDPNNASNGNGDFFKLPHWYQYLKGQPDPLTGKCLPQINNLSDFWAIGLAIMDILLIVGGLVAVCFVIYGGFVYMTSQGEPDKTAAAKTTILNAIIGLMIVLVAIGVVSFIGNSL